MTFLRNLRTISLSFGREKVLIIVIMRTFLNYLEVTIFTKIKNWFQISKIRKNIRFKLWKRMKIKRIDVR